MTEFESSAGPNGRLRLRADPVLSLSTLLFWLFLAIAGWARAQTTPGGSQSAEEKLQQDFTDPLTTLPQLVFRDSYSPANYGPCTHVGCPRDAETNELILRPLIPRVPPHTLLPFAQLIRPTFDLVTVPSSRGGTRTEFGDLPVFDVAVLPWPDRQKTGLLIAVGPSLVARAGRPGTGSGRHLGSVVRRRPGRRPESPVPLL